MSDLKPGDKVKFSIYMLVPDWYDEIDETEFAGITSAGLVKACEAFDKVLEKAGENIAERNAAKASGQTDIYDYV